MICLPLSFPIAIPAIIAQGTPEAPRIGLVRQGHFRKAQYHPPWRRGVGAAKQADEFMQRLTDRPRAGAVRRSVPGGL